jgi:DNA repair exonuclease SbcCD ATPase subunit
VITFKTLRWKNFLSTGNIFTEINLHGASTTLIVGENGSGKSTMLDALTFSLFGKPFRKINKPQLINSITKKDMEVQVEFDIGVNKYKIVRGIKPNVFEVYQNDILLNQSAEVKDYQEILEKQILKINFKSFCQVVVLGSASFVPFMQLPGGQRREIIEDLLDLQIFTVMNSLLKDKVTTNNDEIIQVTNEQKIINEKIKLIHEHMLEQQNNNEKIINEKLERANDSNTKILEEQETYWKLDKEIKEKQELLIDEETVSKKINKLSALKHKIEAKVALLNKDVEFFKNHTDCPTCKQVIDDRFRAEAIETKSSAIEESENGLDMLGKEYDAANADLNRYVEIHSEIRSLTMEQFRVKSRIDSLVKYRDELLNEIDNISKQQEEQDDDKISVLEAEYKDVVVRYNEASEKKQILSAASSLLKDGGIKARIIKQYVPVINRLINKYLSAMEFLVQFELNEEFSETIKSRHRDDFSYASFSEGEKMRINLAVLFTWRAVAKLRNSVNTNLLIMDEVFDSSLDANGTEEFMKILNNLTQDTNTFIISHKTDQIGDKFNNVIRFEKHKNFSKVVS